MTIDRQITGILGTKLGMTQVFDENNRIVPVTVVQAGPNVVTQVRTAEKDGYVALQLAYGAIDPRKVNKPETGHFDQGGCHPAAAPGGAAHLGRGRVRDRPGDHRRGVRARREGRRRRHHQGQGHRGRHEAPRLPRPRREPRHAAQAPLAGLHRRLRHPGPRVQGPADGGSHGPRRGSPRRASPCTASTRSAGSCSSRARSPAPAAGSCSSRAQRRAVPPHDQHCDGRAPRARVRHQRQHRADAPGRRGPAGRGAPGHALHQDPRRGPGRWQEALPPEGHRPRPPGLHAGPAVRRRRRGARPHAARLHPAHPEEDEGRRPARGAFGPGPRGRRLRRRHALAGRHPVHEDGARRPRGRGGRGQDAGRPHRRRPHRAALAAQPARTCTCSRRASSTPTTCSTASAWCSPRRRSPSSSTGRSARRRAPLRPASR